MNKKRDDGLNSGKVKSVAESTKITNRRKNDLDKYDLRMWGAVAWGAVV